MRYLLLLLCSIAFAENPVISNVVYYEEFTKIVKIDSAWKDSAISCWDTIRLENDTIWTYTDSDWTCNQDSCYYFPIDSLVDHVDSLEINKYLDTISVVWGRYITYQMRITLDFFDPNADPGFIKITPGAFYAQHEARSFIENDHVFGIPINTVSKCYYITPGKNIELIFELMFFIKTEDPTYFLGSGHCITISQ